MLPDGWKEAELRDLGTFSKGKGIPKSEVVESGLPCVRYGEIYTSHNYLVREFLSFIPPETAIESKKLKTNDLLFAGSGETREEIGKCVAYTKKDEAYAGGDIVLFSPKPSVINSGFISYYLNTAGRKQINRLGTGHSVVHVYAKDLESVRVVYPSLDEQQMVLEVLSEWDSAKRALTKQISEKQKQKKALMQRLLTGKHRFPEFEGQEWQEVELGDVFKRVRRKNEEVNTSVVTISGQQGFVLQSDYFKKNIASETLDNYFLLHKGEFAYNKSYSNGYPMGAIKRLNVCDKGVVTTLYICFALKDEKKSCANFFEQFFESGSMVRGLSKIANEGGRAHGLLNVTPDDFFKLKMTIPRYAEQQKIAAVLNAADKEIDLLTQKLEAYQEQKKGLMQQLLTGKKRVKLDRKEAA